MTRTPRLARRSIPVAVSSPTQLVLGLRWEQPIDRVHMAPEPTPVAPVVALRRSA